MRDKPFWTTAGLAQAAQVTPRYVRQEIQDGRLPADKWGRDWAILAEDARAWLARPRRGSRKKGAEPKE